MYQKKFTQYIYTIVSEIWNCKNNAKYLPFLFSADVDILRKAKYQSICTKYIL